MQPIRDAKFGMPIDSFKGLVEIDKDIYLATNEDLKLGDYELSQVIYSFYNDQLIAIMLKTKGNANSAGLLSVFQETYGEGIENRWVGKKVIMEYNQNPSTWDAYIMISAKKLIEKAVVDKEGVDSEAAKKL